MSSSLHFVARGAVRSRRAGAGRGGGTCVPRTARRKATHRLGEHGLLVLDAVRLVDHDVVPRVLEEAALLADKHLVRRDDDVEVAGVKALLPEHFALRLCPVEAQGADDRAPDAELAHPVIEHRLRDDHNVLSLDPARFAQVGDHRDRLQRLPETHLVGEDARDAAVVELHNPVQALDLVRAHRALLLRDELRLLLDLLRRVLILALARLQHRRVLDRLLHSAARTARGLCRARALAALLSRHGGALVRRVELGLLH